MGLALRKPRRRDWGTHRQVPGVRGLMSMSMTDVAARAREIAEACDHVLATKAHTRVLNKWNPIPAACEVCITRALADAEQRAQRAEERADAIWTKAAGLDALQVQEIRDLERHLADARRALAEIRAMELGPAALPPPKDAPFHEKERVLLYNKVNRAANIAKAALATPPPSGTGQCRPENHPDDCEPSGP